MRVSTNWLNDYINLNNININDIASKMILVGNEVEFIGKISSATNLVIGYVKEKTKHPDADKLNVCLVDIGNETKQIVCGAKNVTKGQKVIVAKTGAKLPNGMEISKVVIRGVESNGMICSLQELGIEGKYLSGEDKNGIYVLPDDAIVGSDPLKYLGFDDSIVKYELTSNRGDLLSILGMAYEIGAIFDKEINLPDNYVNEIKENIEDYLSLDVKTEEAPLYTVRMVKNIEIKESPNFIKTRLMASGIRSINNVVDISNYVMLEYGQPLHIFDYSKLGNKLVVRMAFDNEEVITFDNELRKLDSNDIVITNGNEVVAVAGVMGALNTEVDYNTNTIVIESAIFNSINIRRTSKKIHRSEASIRFEKGIDSNRTLEAINRACYLLEKYASGKTLKGIICHNNINNISKKIIIDEAKINNVLGMNLSTLDIGNVFRKLKFNFEQIDNKFIVEVPSRRLDISIVEDLIEEIGRIHGYDNMNGILPVTTVKEGRYSNNYLKRKRIRKKLESLGLKQVITYSLVNKDIINNFTNDKFDYIEIKNPMSEDKKILRYSILPSLLKVVDYNFARNIKDINIFEIGSSYYNSQDSNIEEEKIACMMVGNYITNLWQNKQIEVDFYLVKGILEELFNYLGIIHDIQFIKAINPPKEYHIGRTAEVLLDNVSIGYIGCINPSINKLPIYMFELSLNKINNKKVHNIKHKEISKYPSVIKDLAFILDKNIETISIVNNIKEISGSSLVSIDIFDIYSSDNLGLNKKSIAFTLEFRDLTKTLVDYEIKPLIDNIIKEIEHNYNAKLRDK